MNSTTVNFIQYTKVHPFSTYTKFSVSTQSFSKNYNFYPLNFLLNELHPVQKTCIFTAGIGRIIVFQYDANVTPISFSLSISSHLANIYVFKVNKINTRKCEICLKLTIKTHVPEVVLVSLLLTINIFHTFF